MLSVCFGKKKLHRGPFNISGPKCLLVFLWSKHTFFFKERKTKTRSTITDSDIYLIIILRPFVLTILG